MSLTENDIAEVVGLFSADVARTLGGRVGERVVSDRAEVLREFIDEPAWFSQKLVEDVQQEIHDLHVDTTWPTCPIHRRHPLWLDEGPTGPWHWRCAETGRSFGELGSLRLGLEPPG